MNNCINHTMLKDEFGIYSVFRDFDMHKLLNDTWSCKTNKGSWLGKDHVPEHSKAR